MLAAVKIAVLVKEVPDASAPRRLDPSTFRLDRSGEGALNEFDAHALEEALRVKDGDASTEVVVLSMGPARAAETLRKALAMGADRVAARLRRRRRRLGPGRDLRVLAKAIERESADLVLLRPAGRRLGRGRPLGRARRPAAPAARLPGRDARARRRQGEVEAPDRVRLRRARGAAARASSPCPTPSTSRATRRSRGSWARRRSRRSRSRSPISASRRTRPASPARAPRSTRVGAPAAARRHGAHRGRGRRLGRADPRVPPGAEARSDGHAGLRRAPRRRARRGRRSACSRRRRRSAATWPPCSSARACAGSRRGSARTARPRSTSRTIPRSPTRCRSRAWTCSPSSCATRASTPSSSRRPCSAPTWPPGSPRASTPA